jgi:hypothetical protein
MENPFTVYSPEDISPGTFKEIFVKEYTWVNALETPKDFFIYGSRGSGKSMLLNYLEFSHQLCYRENNLLTFFKEKKKEQYIGIMIHVTSEELNTKRYELLKQHNLGEEGLIDEICMTDLIMAILHRLVTTFTKNKQMADYLNGLDRQEVIAFCCKAIEDLDRKKVHEQKFGQAKANIESLRTLADEFLDERESIKYYANEKLQMRDTKYQSNYASFNYLREVICQMKRLLVVDNFSFYVLIDNGDEAGNTMQLCINRLISQRNHKEICFKVAVKKGAPWSTEGIMWPHDYSQIDIDELYSTQHSVYYGRVKEIANKRLKLACINETIENFLAESESERKLFQEIRHELKQKYEKEYRELGEKDLVQEPPTRAEWIANRVSKYAQAELFRRLRKTGKSYAGFNNIVHLSSGIIRQFLDICSYIFDEETKRRGGPFTVIGLQTQNDVIKKYADDFMDELEKKYKRLEREDHREAESYKDLYLLIDALGKYYKKRLMDPDLKEPRVFTFTLKDRGKDPRIDRILGIGVDENYFQSYWYSSKTGIGKFKGYAFNRRLCPRYVIDHTSFRGRVELTSADLSQAIKTGRVSVPSSYFAEDEGPTLDNYTGGYQNV